MRALQVTIVVLVVIVILTTVIPAQAKSMRWQQGKLLGVPFYPTPNQGGLMPRKPRAIILHYTASTNLETTLRWLQSPLASVSAHFLIDQKGNVFQLVGCDEVAWHAGVSEWKGISNLNDDSIGIELLNAGRIENGEIGGKDVALAFHKNGGNEAYWERYPAAQLKACRELIKAIRKQYPTIQDVIGHDDVSPGRKIDPGPLLPGSLYDYS